MQDAKPEQTPVNDSGTQAPADTGSARGRSGPVRYAIVTKDGVIWTGRQFNTRAEAAKCAEIMWPDQFHDPEHTGAGWDVAAVQS